jgi:hypothetical protein
VLASKYGLVNNYDPWRKGLATFPLRALKFMTEVKLYQFNTRAMQIIFAQKLSWENNISQHIELKVMGIPYSKQTPPYISKEDPKESTPSQTI